MCNSCISNIFKIILINDKGRPNQSSLLLFITLQELPEILQKRYSRNYTKVKIRQKFAVRTIIQTILYLAFESLENKRELIKLLHKCTC